MSGPATVVEAFRRAVHTRVPGLDGLGVRALAVGLAETGLEPGTPVEVDAADPQQHLDLLRAVLAAGGIVVDAPSDSRGDSPRDASGDSPGLAEETVRAADAEHLEELGRRVDADHPDHFEVLASAVTPPDPAFLRAVPGELPVVIRHGDVADAARSLLQWLGAGDASAVWCGVPLGARPGLLVALALHPLLGGSLEMAAATPDSAASGTAGSGRAGAGRTASDVVASLRATRPEVVVGEREAWARVAQVASAVTDVGAPPGLLAAYRRRPHSRLLRATMGARLAHELGLDRCPAPLAVGADGGLLRRLAAEGVQVADLVVSVHAAGGLGITRPLDTTADTAADTPAGTAAGTAADTGARRDRASDRATDHAGDTAGGAVTVPLPGVSLARDRDGRLLARGAGVSPWRWDDGALVAVPGPHDWVPVEPPVPAGRLRHDPSVE